MPYQTKEQRHARGPGWTTGFIVSAPESIHSHKGPKFESRLFGESCQMPEIWKTRTTAYHPTRNAQAGNANKRIKGVLMATVENDPETWDRNYGPCMMAYWSIKHISTGYTPFTLMCDREMQLPLDAMVDDPEAASDHYGDYMSLLKGCLSNAFQDVRENLRTTQHRQKEYFDCGAPLPARRPGISV